MRPSRDPVRGLAPRRVAGLKEGINHGRRQLSQMASSRDLVEQLFKQRAERDAALILDEAGARGKDFG